MAFETGQWIAAQQWGRVALCSTPTTRTQQTAQEIRLALQCDVPIAARDLPELDEDLDALLDALTVNDAGVDAIICVGHHPTMDLLRRRYALPVPVPQRHLASAIALAVTPGRDVHCVAAWPGRPSN